MRKTKQSSYGPKERLLMNTAELQDLLGCGRDSAVKLGLQAGAKLTIGARVFWKVACILEYLS